MRAFKRGRARLPQGGDPERRSSPRFAVDLQLRYTVKRRGAVQVAGYGQTINVSSSGLYFRAEDVISVGQTVVAAVDWPAQLERNIPLQLMIYGVVVRTDGPAAAIAIERYEFKTRRATHDPA